MQLEVGKYYHTQNGTIMYIVEEVIVIDRLLFICDTVNVDKNEHYNNRFVYYKNFDHPYVPGFDIISGPFHTETEALKFLKND